MSNLLEPSQAFVTRPLFRTKSPKSPGFFWNIQSSQWWVWSKCRQTVDVSQFIFNCFYEGQVIWINLISTLLFDDLRSLKTDKQLMFCDLPRNISVLESPFKISYLDNKYGFLNPGQSMSFLFQNKHNSISYQRILHEFYTKKECYISFWFSQ